MDELNLYQVIFNGQITEEFDLATTKQKFARIFRLDANKTERIFSGKDFILKSNITEQAATDYAMKLLETGCECYVELMPQADDISQQPGFVENRKSIRRRIFRREPRTGVLIPDRREQPSRRSIDLFLLKKSGDFPGNSAKNPTQHTGDKLRSSKS